ncbi:MAG: hypothetical protein JXR07_12295 [Reichenbachiella sp.]
MGLWIVIVLLPIVLNDQFIEALLKDKSFIEALENDVYQLIWSNDSYTLITRIVISP